MDEKEYGVAPSELMGSSAAPTARSEVEEELRLALLGAYRAMRVALSRCRKDVNEAITETEEIRKLRIAIFNDLELPAVTAGGALERSRLYPSSSTEPPSSGEAKGREE
jgi:uncharacterized protein YwlG (UPF0340 family)